MLCVMNVSCQNLSKKVAKLSIKLFCSTIYLYIHNTYKYYTGGCKENVPNVKLYPITSSSKVFFCLKLKIHITIELNQLSILVNHHIGLGMVLGYFSCLLLLDASSAMDRLLSVSPFQVKLH